jgi:glyoxylase-like metal-dependent hydrolase (beta-lactamase superfamily II)
MIHEILQVGMLVCNCLVFGDEITREAMVVDPGDEAEEILRVVKHHRLSVTAIVLTHAHFDHVGAAAEVKAATGAPVYLHEDGLAGYAQIEMQASWLGLPVPASVDIDVFPRDGDVLYLGSVEFHVLHTPGHSPGSISLWIPSEKKLVAGDTLFRDSVGRTDLPGGDGRQLLASIRDKFLTLPDDTLVIPGHGPTTTIGHERKSNPFLQNISRDF